MINEFKQSISKEYNIKVLNDIKCTYSDLLVMMLLSNYERVIELIERGLSNTEVEKVMNLKMQTIRNYRSKSNKL